jgi:hypothetical protein
MDCTFGVWLQTFVGEQVAVVVLSDDWIPGLKAVDTSCSANKDQCSIDHGL